MNTTSVRLMIVEDDLLLLMVEERLIKNLGYDVIAKASEGQQALRLIREKNPELLIIDIHLNGRLTGLDIVEQLKEEEFDISVIFLSGEKNGEMIERAKILGVEDYLVKPITLHGLKRSIEKAISKRNSSIHKE